MIDNDSRLSECVQANTTKHNDLRDRSRFYDMSYDRDGVDYLGPYDCVLALDCVYKSNSASVARAIIRNTRAGGSAIVINPLRDGLHNLAFALMEYGDVDISSIVVEFGEHTMELQQYIFIAYK